MHIPDFEKRLPAFREGFDAFLAGNLTNPYINFKNGKPHIQGRFYLASKEYQHGQDVAYLLTQHFNAVESEAEYA